MSIVSLVSGGLDSTLMALLAKEENIIQFPLFIDYGQLCKEMELTACLENFRKLNLPTPRIVRLEGYGSLISSGLTDANKRIFEDAFVPCRNLLFLTTAAAYAYQCGANTVAIGLLNESFSIFPDQTVDFIRSSETLLSKCLNFDIHILTPLMSFSKADVLRIAKFKGIDKTYSCHAGTEKPCGVCVSCREYINLEV